MVRKKDVIAESSFLFKVELSLCRRKESGFQIFQWIDVWFVRLILLFGIDGIIAVDVVQSSAILAQAKKPHSFIKYVGHTL